MSNEPTELQGFALLRTPKPCGSESILTTSTSFLMLHARFYFADAARYNIVVKTGTKHRAGTLDGPGTDATVKVILYGISRATNQQDHTDKLELSGSLFVNLFESGK